MGLISSFPGDPLIEYSADGATRIAIAPGVPVFNPATRNWMVFAKVTGASVTGGNVVVCAGSQRYNGTVQLSTASTVAELQVAGVRPTGAAAVASGNYGYFICHGPASSVSALTGSAITAADLPLINGTAVGCVDLFTAATTLASIRLSAGIWAYSQTAGTTANIVDINIVKSVWM